MFLLSKEKYDDRDIGCIMNNYLMLLIIKNNKNM